MALPADRERLLGYVWPDQADRLARVEAAMNVAAADAPPLDRAEAAAWTEAGVARVLMRAVALQYAPEETTSRTAAHAARVGAAANRSPCTWLRLQAGPEFGERVLALGDMHGEALRWLGWPAGVPAAPRAGTKDHAAARSRT